MTHHTLTPEILIGHRLGRGGGWTFICNGGGEAVRFDSPDEARTYIEAQGLNAQAEIWQVVMLVGYPLDW